MTCIAGTNVSNWTDVDLNRAEVLYYYNRVFMRRDTGSRLDAEFEGSCHIDIHTYLSMNWPK